MADKNLFQNDRSRVPPPDRVPPPSDVAWGCQDPSRACRVSAPGTLSAGAGCGHPAPVYFGGGTLHSEIVSKKIAGYSGLPRVPLAACPPVPRLTVLALAASLGMHAALAGALCIVASVGGHPEAPPAPDYGDRLRPVQVVWVPQQRPEPPQPPEPPPAPPSRAADETQPPAPARTPAPQPPQPPAAPAPDADADAAPARPEPPESRKPAVEAIASPVADSAPDENSPPAASRQPQAAPSQAPETPPSPIPVPGGASPPRRRGLPSAEIVNLPVPEYPPRSRRLGEEGLVLLEVEVLPGGEVGQVRVLQAPGYPRLVAAAIEAIRKATFKPALSDGLPIRSLVEIPIRFRLD